MSGLPRRRTCALTISLCLAALAAAAASHAQTESRFGVAAWMDPRVPNASSRISPAWFVAGPAASLSLQGVGSMRDQRMDPRAFMASGSVWMEKPAVNGREITVRFAHREHGPRGELTSVRAEYRQHVMRPLMGAWLGLGTEVNNGAVTHDVWPALAIGGWARRDRFLMIVDVAQSVGRVALRSSRARTAPDTGFVAPLPDSLRVPGEEKDATLTTARATVQWSKARVALESSAGVTMSPRANPMRWARLLATYQVSARMALFASVGQGAPALHTFEPADERHATVGLRLLESRAPLTPATLAVAPRVGYRITKLLDGRYELIVWAPDVERVEIMGDMTEWSAVALSRVGSARWSTVLRMSKGAHQVSLRLDDGEWVPLPGAPTAPDGYGGSVGVIVAE